MAPGVPTPVHDELHRVDVTGIIWRKDEDGKYRYLITKRAPHKKAWPGKWTVPGGGVHVHDYVNGEATYQNDESPQWYNAIEKALRRECLEEVGVEVDSVQYLLDVAFIGPDGIPRLVLSYFCRYVRGEIALDDSATEHAWVTAEEASSYDLIQGIDHEILEVEKRLSN
ncbi:MAG: nucleoside triphosphatase [Candidatus Parcubacteria bacterium]|jgi:8-oxo-dGTP pyrophosphatase MutT (NUDIX family)|nr:nucleoside triphosphatase [Candidatus Parcubacteria bacterium]